MSAAEQCFRKALEVEPKHSEALCQLAGCLNGRAEKLQARGQDLAAAASLYIAAADSWEVRHGKHNSYSRTARSKAAQLLGVKSR